MSDAGWGVTLVIVVVIAIAAIIIVATWQSLKTNQARHTSKADIARDDAYRKLAEEAVAAQRATAEQQQQIAGELAELRTRMSAIEKVLHEVG